MYNNNNKAWYGTYFIEKKQEKNLTYPQTVASSASSITLYGEFVYNFDVYKEFK